MTNLAAYAGLLESSALGVWMRTSSIAYPAINLIHLLGLILLLGCMVLLDLRLLGVGRRIPLSDISALLTPLAVAGLITMLASGVLLFSADAQSLLINPLFPYKLAFIAVAIANAIAFRVRWSSIPDGWNNNVELSAKVQAALSLALWTSAAAAGRLLAYV